MSILNREKKKPLKKTLKDRIQSLRRGSERSLFYEIAIILFLSLIVAIVISPQFMIFTPTYHIGDVAKQDIKAPQDFLVEDEAATQKKIEEAESKVLCVYDYNSRAI